MDMYLFENVKISLLMVCFLTFELPFISLEKYQFKKKTFKIKKYFFRETFALKIKQTSQIEKWSIINNPKKSQTRDTQKFVPLCRS